MRKLLSATSGTAIALVMASAQPTFAQSNDGTPQAGTEDVIGLSDIVVTAQRREESLQRAAISVTAITSDELVRRGVSDVGQLQNMAPALQVANSYGPSTQLTLRGVGNAVLNVNIDSAITVNLDGVPIGRPTSIHGLFYDLERIEVLKGPQGTLYGRNATGGAINAITQKPVYGEHSGYVNAAYGNYDALDMSAAINLPVSDNAALRIAGSLAQHDGYYSDGQGDQRLRAVRGTFRTDISDTVTLTISGDYAHTGGNGAGATLTNFDPDDRIGLRDPRTEPFYTGSFSLPTFSFLEPLSVAGVPDHQDNAMWGISANLDIETSIGTVTILPSYRKTKLDFHSTAGGFHAPVKETNEQKTLEVRLVSDQDRALQYIFGGFYMEEDNESFVGFNQQYFAAYGVFAPTSKAYAGYGRLTYSVTPEFRVSAAARYTSDKRSTFQDVVNAIVLCPSAFADPTNPANFCIGAPGLPVGLNAPALWSDGMGGYLPSVPNLNPNPGPGMNDSIISITYGGPFRDKKTFNKLTWRAGVEYDVGPQSLFYATFETGFKAGGFFNAPAGFDASFDPETVDAFTVGTKNRFLDNRLQLNAEVFWWTYKGKQFSHIIPLPASVGGGTTFATENVGKSRLRGFEVEVLGKATENTTLSLNVQYLDAEERSYEYVSAGPLAPQTGCDVTPNGANFDVSCSGKTSVNSPEWTINAGVEHIFPLASGADIKVNLGTRYQSEAQTSYDFFAGGIQEGYWMSDAYLTYESPDDKYYITGYIRNIEDTAAKTFTSAHPRVVPPFPQLVRASLTSPRTYGVRVGVKF